MLSLVFEGSQMLMGGFDFCDAKMLREGCFKKYIQAPLIGMRIWFGLILKIMVRLCICQLKMFKKSLLCISPPVPKWFN